MGGGSPRKFNPHEKLLVHNTGIARREHGVRKMLSIRRRSVKRRLASAIAAEGILDDIEPLRSGIPLSGHRYFRSAIVEVQAHVRTVIPYVANYLLAQFFVGLIFVGNTRPRKLNSHENFCVYGMYTCIVSAVGSESENVCVANYEFRWR